MGYDLGSLQAIYTSKPDRKSKKENFTGYNIKALTIIT